MRQVACTYSYKGLGDQQKVNKAMLSAFVKTYKKDKLWQQIPGRQHDSFKSFVPSPLLEKPSSFKEYLILHNFKVMKEIIAFNA